MPSCLSFSSGATSSHLGNGEQAPAGAAGGDAGGGLHRHGPDERRRGDGAGGVRVRLPHVGAAGRRRRPVGAGAAGVAGGRAVLQGEAAAAAPAAADTDGGGAARRARRRRRRRAAAARHKHGAGDAVRLVHRVAGELVLRQRGAQRGGVLPGVRGQARRRRRGGVREEAVVAEAQVHEAAQPRPQAQGLQGLHQDDLRRQTGELRRRRRQGRHSWRDERNQRTLPWWPPPPQSMEEEPVRPDEKQQVHRLLTERRRRRRRRRRPWFGRRREAQRARPRRPQEVLLQRHRPVLDVEQDVPCAAVVVVLLLLVGADVERVRRRRGGAGAAEEQQRELGGGEPDPGADRLLQEVAAAGVGEEERQRRRLPVPLVGGVQDRRRGIRRPGRARRDLQRLMTTASVSVINVLTMARWISESFVKLNKKKKRVLLKHPVS